MNSLGKPVAIVAALAAALVGCSDSGDSTKAGGGSPPVTLRIGTNEGPGVPEADQIEEFVRQVKSLSDGRLIIEPVWEAAGDVNDREQVVARKVVGGELDMGLIPTRAWDTEGVTSLRALQAPFLVSSDELVAEVITSDLATVMLAGLDDMNVTGLALLPSGIRHLFVFGDGGVNLLDLDGKAVRAPTSETTRALFTALGATADDYPGDAFRDGVRNGTIQAAESDFVFAACCLPAPSTVAANVALFPKVGSLVVNTEVYDTLGDDDRQALRQAATRTRDWAVSGSSADAKRAEAFCQGGGTVVNASDGENAAMEQAVTSVYQTLQRDATTKNLIERIRTIKADLPAPPAVAPCKPGTTNQTARADGTATFPGGVYRMEITAEFLIAAGVDRATAVNQAGTWTLTFDDGQVTVADENASTHVRSTCVGTYSVHDGRVELLMGPDPMCGDAADRVLFSAVWTLEGDQLQFTDVRAGNGSDLLIATQFGRQPLTKIG